MEASFYPLLAILTFLAVFALGAAFLVARSTRRKRLEARLKHLLDGPYGEDPEGKRDTIGMLARVAKALSPGKPSERLKAQLARAGFYRPSAPAVYLGAKMVFLIVGIAGAALATLPFRLSLGAQVLVPLMAGAFLSFLPNSFLSAARKKRREQ